MKGKTKCQRPVDNYTTGIMTNNLFSVIMRKKGLVARKGENYDDYT